MKIISVLSQKGGSGKTTAAVHLAAAYGDGVALIDCDPQGSAEKWAERRESAHPEVVGYKIYSNRGAKNLINLSRENGIKTVIFDGQPRAGKAEHDLADLSDVVVVTTRASILDLEAIENTLSIAEAAGTPVIVLISAAQTRQLEYAEALQWIQQRVPKAQVATLGQRVIYGRALSSGAAVSELKDAESKQAAQEIDALVKMINSIKRKVTA